MAIQLSTNIPDTVPAAGGRYQIRIHETEAYSTPVKIFLDTPSNFIAINPSNGVAIGTQDGSLSKDVVVDVLVGNNASGNTRERLVVVQYQNGTLIGSYRIKQGINTQSGLRLNEGTAFVLNISRKASTFNDIVYTNSSVWYCNENLPSWLKVNPLIGSGNQTPITITATANNNKDDRSFIIDLRSSNSELSAEHAYIIVVQEGHGIQIQTNVPDEVPVNGGTYDIRILNSKSTTVEIETTSPLPDWLSLNPSSGTAGYLEMKVNISRNDNPNSRVFNIAIRIASDNTVVGSVYVYQAGNIGNKITIDGKTEVDYKVFEYGEIITSLLNSESSWSVASQLPSWLHVNPLSGGIGSSDIEITADKNNSTQKRSFKIEFKTDNGLNSAFATIEQYGATLEITSNIPDIVPASGGNYQIRIRNINYSCAPWVASSVSAWLILYPTSGQACYGDPDEIIEVTIPANELPDQRNTEIEIKSDLLDYTFWKLNVKQEAGQGERRFYIPILNPIPFTKDGVNEKKRSDADYQCYCQKFQRNDSTTLQFINSGYESVVAGIRAVNENEETVYSFTVNVFKNVIQDNVVSEVIIDFSLLPEGLYTFILDANNKSYYSGKISIKENHPFTELITYRNTENKQNVAFSTSSIYSIRVELEEYQGLNPNSNDEIYSDDLGQFEILDSDPYDTLTINIGGKYGIPDWLISIINRVFSLDTVILFNSKISKTEGAKFEPLQAERYNLRSWLIDIVKIQNNYIYNEEESRWILITGFWNDKGIWEDTAKWND